MEYEAVPLPLLKSLKASKILWVSELLFPNAEEENVLFCFSELVFVGGFQILSSEYGRKKRKVLITQFKNFHDWVAVFLLILSCLFFSFLNDVVHITGVISLSNCFYIFVCLPLSTHPLYSD